MALILSGNCWCDMLHNWSECEGCWPLEAPSCICCTLDLKCPLKTLRLKVPRVMLLRSDRAIRGRKWKKSCQGTGTYPRRGPWEPILPILGYEVRISAQPWYQTMLFWVAKGSFHKGSDWSQIDTPKTMSQPKPSLFISWLSWMHDTVTESWHIMSYPQRKHQLLTVGSYLLISSWFLLAKVSSPFYPKLSLSIRKLYWPHCTD